MPSLSPTWTFMSTFVDLAAQGSRVVVEAVYSDDRESPKHSWFFHAKGLLRPQPYGTTWGFEADLDQVAGPLLAWYSPMKLQVTIQSTGGLTVDVSNEEYGRKSTFGEARTMSAFWAKFTTMPNELPEDYDFPLKFEWLDLYFHTPPWLAVVGPWVAHQEPAVASAFKPTDPSDGT